MIEAFKKLNEKKTIKRGDIWEVKTDRGIEKALVISNDVGNDKADIVTVAHMMRGNKRKPTQMQVGMDIVMFENVATYAKQRLIEKQGEVTGNFTQYLGYSIDPFTSVPRGIQYLSPTKEIKWGEFYFLNLGEGKGSEQAGVRLCLVVSNNVLNRVGREVTIIPCTTKLKRSMPTHIEISSSIGIPQDSTLLGEQVRTVSSHLFQQEVPVAVLPKTYYDDVKQCLEIVTAEDVKEKIQQIKRERQSKRLAKNA